MNPEDMILPNDRMLAEKLRSIDMKTYNNIHDYNRDLGIDIDSMARKYIRKQGSFTWYDMCCGNFKSGQDLMQESNWKGEEELRELCSANGINLTALIPGRFRGTNIIRENIVKFKIPQKSDLITFYKAMNLVTAYVGIDPLISSMSHWYDSLNFGGILAIEYDKRWPVQINDVDFLEHMKKQHDGEIHIMDRNPTFTLKITKLL